VNVDRDESSSFVIGAVILVIGAALLVDRMGILPWTSQWSVWPLLLIAFGVANLIESPWRGKQGIFPIALGIWIWVVQAGALSLQDSWPLLIVVLGFSVMWQTWGGPAEREAPVPGRRRRQGSPIIAFAIIASIVAATTIDARHYAVKNVAGGQTHVFAVLGGHEEHITPQSPFTGGQVVAVMGGSVLDLRDANVPEGGEVTVDVVAFWGSAVVRVPEGWTVDVRTVPVLGGVLDRRGMPEATDIRTRTRARGRERTDTWLTDSQTWLGAPSPQGSPRTQSSQAAQSSQTTQSSQVSPASQGAQDGSTTKARLVLTGSVVMGSLVIR
jgi:cell wall-active antibiotic response 4TMS protein YvqF